MKHSFPFIFITLWVAVFSTQISNGAEKWSIDKSHSAIGFKIRHLMVTNVMGQFSEFEGSFNVDEKDFTKSSLEGSIETASINTGNTKRDDHLRAEDFFDAKKYPKITFKSKKIESTAPNKYKIIGDLTMHGVTKEITLESDGLTPTITDPWGNPRRGFSATTVLNRSDYKITWNKKMDGGGIVLGEEIPITIEFEFEKPSSEKSDKKAEKNKEKRKTEPKKKN